MLSKIIKSLVVAFQTHQQDKKEKARVKHNREQREAMIKALEERGY